MSFNKITTSDLTNKGVSGLPDTPGLSTSEMQRKFDEIGKEVIVPKFNELVDELNKNGNVIKASDIVGIRVNANKQIEVTTDFNAWYATASSGHVVIDKNGNTLPQRGTMKFVGESLVYDDPEHEQTVITAIQGAQGEEGPIGPVGPKGDRGQVYIPSIDEQGNISWTPADYTVPPAVRNIRGPQGVQGVQGPRGERGYNGKDGRSFSVLGQYESLEALQIAHPVGNEGDAYSVQLAEGNTIYLWDVDKREWVDIGSLQGPQGPQGEQGIQGIQGPPGIQGERGIPTSVNGLIGESIEVTPAVIPYTESKSLADLLGTTDISEYSDGTVTGAIKSACDGVDSINSKLGNTDISAIGDGTLTGGLDALNSKLGNTDISAIGDGTVTGGLDALNSNLIIESVEFIPSISAYKVGRTIEIYTRLSNLEKVTNIKLGNTQYKSVNAYTILPLYSTASPYIVIGSLWIYSTGVVEIFKPSETTDCYISGNYTFT